MPRPPAFTLAPLAAADALAVEALLDAAFGRDRHARTAYKVRADATAIAAVSFAAFDGPVLVGSLQSWPVALDAAPLLLVGPVAVAPDRQRQGIGVALMDALIAAAPDLPMAMIGDPEYYGRWGFAAEATRDWVLPGPVERHRLLARNADTLPASGRLGPGRPDRERLASAGASA